MGLHLPSSLCTPRRLVAALLAAFVLPWLLGEWAKTGLQPGLAEDAVRAAMRVDFIVLGAMLFGAAMLIVLACGCWIVHVMKGPARRGDPFPADEPGPQP
jgi:hypothetical protein